MRRQGQAGHDRIGAGKVDLKNWGFGYRISGITSGWIVRCASLWLALFVSVPIAAQQVDVTSGSRECETFAWSYTYYSYDPVADRVREGSPITLRYGTSAAAQAAYHRAREKDAEEANHWDEAAAHDARFDVPEHERRHNRGWKDASRRQLASYRAPHCVEWRVVPPSTGSPTGSGPVVGPSHPSELDPHTREGARKIRDILENNETTKRLVATHPFLQILDPLARDQSMSALRDVEKALRDYDWDTFQSLLEALNKTAYLALATVIGNQCFEHRRKGRDLDLRYWEEFAQSFDFPADVRRAAMLDRNCGGAVATAGSDGSLAGRWCIRKADGSCGTARLVLSGKGALSGSLSGKHVSDKQSFSAPIRGVTPDDGPGNQWNGRVDCGRFHLQDKSDWGDVSFTYRPASPNEPATVEVSWECSIASAEFMRISERRGVGVTGRSNP